MTGAGGGQAEAVATMTRASRAKAKGRRKAKQSDTLEGLARAGMAARGALYALVGVIALQIAVNGDNGEQADKLGAFEALAQRSYGRPLLAALAVGFLGYALWRLVQAVLDPEGVARDGADRLKRVGWGLRALLYLWFFASVLPFALGSRREAGDEKEQEATAALLDKPLGRWVVVAVGVTLLGMAAYNGWRAVSGSYAKDLPRKPSRWARPFAVAGLLARMALFGVVGAFLLRAAAQSDPDQAVGLDGALHRVAGGWLGTSALLALAVGLIAFGVFCAFQARYRKVLDD